jgi:integrase
VRRFRDSLSSFFAWAVRERMIPTNPVTPTRVPKSSTPRTEMYPFSEEELEELYGRAVQRDQRLADILLVGAWTGLRWSELRAVRVRDFVEVRYPSWWCSGPSRKVCKSRARSRADIGGFRSPIVCCPLCGRLLLAARPTTSSASPPRGTDCTPPHSSEH